MMEVLINCLMLFSNDRILGLLLVELIALF